MIYAIKDTFLKYYQRNIGTNFIKYKEPFKLNKILLKGLSIEKFKCHYCVFMSKKNDYIDPLNVNKILLTKYILNFIYYKPLRLKLSIPTGEDGYFDSFGIISVSGNIFESFR